MKLKSYSFYKNKTNYTKEVHLSGNVITVNTFRFFFVEAAINMLNHDKAQCKLAYNKKKIIL